MSQSLGLFRFKMAMTIPTWCCREGEMERCPTWRGHPINADARPFASSVPHWYLQLWMARIRAASDLECESSLIS